MAELTRLQRLIRENFLKRKATKKKFLLARAKKAHFLFKAGKFKAARIISKAKNLSDVVNTSFIKSERKKDDKQGNFILMIVGFGLAAVVLLIFIFKK